MNRWNLKKGLRVIELTVRPPWVISSFWVFFMLIKGQLGDLILKFNELLNISFDILRMSVLWVAVPLDQRA
jgi:hypothetical protein